MANTTKIQLQKNMSEEIWGNFSKAVSKAKSKEDFQKIFSKIMPEKELLILEKRIGIIHLLSKGYSYGKIREILEINDCTISAVRKNFKKEKELKRKVIKNFNFIDFFFEEPGESIFRKYRFSPKKIR